MKMSILGIEYKNIRKIADLKLLFTDDGLSPFPQFLLSSF